MLRAFRSSGTAGITPVIIADAQYAELLFSHGAFCKRTASAEFPVHAGEARADMDIVLIRKPQAEARFKIVVPGELVVIAEAFRAVAGKADGDSAFIFGEERVQHLLPALLIQQPGFFKTFHR